VVLGNQGLLLKLRSTRCSLSRLTAGCVVISSAYAEGDNSEEDVMEPRVESRGGTSADNTRAAAGG
jgi:hypothetical protein